LFGFDLKSGHFLFGGHPKMPPKKEIKTQKKEMKT